MSEFFRESPELNEQDQSLLRAYAEVGCSVDSLPYTSEFEDLVGRIRARGDTRSKNEVLKRLMTLRKAGKLPRSAGLSTRKGTYADSSEEAEGRRIPSSSGKPGTQKPRIGLNADARAAQADAPAFSFLGAAYYDAVMMTGGIPVILPPLQSESDINDVLDMLDGVIFTGGADLDPRHDGFMRRPSMRLLNDRREVFDRLLMRLVATRKLPVFGIGVGMQLLNVSQGGSLFLHIPEDLPRALPHLDSMDRTHRHALEVAPGSLMERVFGEGEICVNSMHHMAVDDIASGFELTAWCPDGVVEAIESADPSWFAFGTQFHPESSSASSLDLGIFKEFVTGCRKRVAMLAGGPVRPGS